MGELYIERKEVSQILRKKVFFVEEGDYGKCYSLIGPNGIGKTTLIRHLSDELERAAKPHTYYLIRCWRQEPRSGSFGQY